MPKECFKIKCCYPVFAKGLCIKHWRAEYGKPIKINKLLESKPRQLIRRTPVKKTAAEIQKDNALNVFFASQALQVPENCENCGLPLFAYSDANKRFVTAHILPKKDKQFPSVATHPLNRMFLGFGLFSSCNCHGDWDNKDADARIKMPCYSLAIERLQSFKSLLIGEEIGRAEKYLKTTI
jgi:hypothetical protein